MREEGWLLQALFSALQPLLLLEADFRLPESLPPLLPQLALQTEEALLVPVWGSVSCSCVQLSPHWVIALTQLFYSSLFPTLWAWHPACGSSCVASCGENGGKGPSTRQVTRGGFVSWQTYVPGGLLPSQTSGEPTSGQKLDSRPGWHKGCHVHDLCLVFACRAVLGSW